MRAGKFETRVLARGNMARIFVSTMKGWQHIGRLHADGKVELMPATLAPDDLEQLAIFARAAAKMELKQERSFA